MESLLWALDLGAVVFLCMWALKQEKAIEKEKAGQQQDQGRKNNA